MHIRELWLAMVIERFANITQNGTILCSELGEGGTLAKCLIMCTSSVDAVLHVVSQLELYRMGAQVRLPAQIGLVVFAHIVVD